MTIASRTPEGFPSHCPLCGHATEIEYSDPGEDAVCPQCGYRLLLSVQLLHRYRLKLAPLMRIPAETIIGRTPLKGMADPVRLVEAVLEDVTTSDDEFPWDHLESFRTVGDLLRFKMQQRGVKMD